MKSVLRRIVPKKQGSNHLAKNSVLSAKVSSNLVKNPCPAGYLITRQSQVRILPPQLVLTVSKLRSRRVIRKADIFGCRPFRVLSPVLATTSGITTRIVVSPSARRATQLRHDRVGLMADLVRNSLLSLCLAKSGLLGVASAQSVHFGRVASCDRCRRPDAA